MWDQDQYIKAWNFASVAHNQQLVPGTDNPYINHIGLVAMEVMSACSRQTIERFTTGQSTTELATIEKPTLAVLCALLHDTIEDTATTYDDVVEQFGLAVAKGVLALTKDNALPTKQAKMVDSLNRIKQQPKDVWLVKLADRITNLQIPPAHWNKEKINKYSTEAKLILTELGSANEYLGTRLKNKIADYQQYC
ncbi:MAG: bifunctional (p)ppGpp synthetase/guanosine-3',5'-bis(diphosphate) 3'-pyrophosphohydrolase [Algicola sp.]|nr:bifunctional (p)ppGpp synthetase/guanosine-3',5'-bis(diphosphate) 3'-pyrophosphohydrolase [Algicola sp.]